MIWIYGWKFLLGFFLNKAKNSVYICDMKFILTVIESLLLCIAKDKGIEQDKFCPQEVYNDKEDEEVYFQGE